MARTISIDSGWQAALLSRLEDYRRTSLQYMQSVVPAREPRRHLYEPISEYIARIGKSVRPALCIATCMAHGGAALNAEPSAAALEMLHNAFLVHDDVEDESEYRRGKPAMHQQHGVPLAVNTGDMMNALGMRILRDNLAKLDYQLSARVLREFDHLLVETLEGQAMELGWVHDNRGDVLEEDYLRMVLKKTCWYSFIQPCRIGALIAQPAREDLDRFNRFGYYVGLAFQIQDDLLNLTGDPAKYGKEIGGDLLEGKRTLMLIHLLRHSGNDDRKRVLRFMAQPRPIRSQEDMHWIMSRMNALGSFAYGRKVARQFAGAALYEFEQAFAFAPESEHKTFVYHIVRYMVTRDQ